ncbi:cryptococcal mannosyltransferase 1-domain-containing protein [Apodospora peruviana]|uniref:Cryptococcal mannosyltransferase 1-domain-containing protein n=1 Tax=Apodospora peruviana TaxID=516989 RepID=A0AAE0M1V5_9PEZI|nr:cryptococcal mannosyltransferase 1-domain-containing protein [Apodospora peruviana]
MLITLVVTPFLAPSYTRPPPHYGELAMRCKTAMAGCANSHNEKVFISTILYDSNGQLAGGLWGQRLHALIHLLGPENVFLSIYENDSGPGGRAALGVFKRDVRCRHRIVIEDHVSLAGFRNVTLPDGSQRTKRVAYLAELRNRALWPLDTLIKFNESSSSSGYNIDMRFDKVLFMNDIAFDPIDAAHLLFNTNRQPELNGGKAAYVAACALDYFHPLRIYDVYAMRDAEGYANYQTLFPYFRARPGGRKSGGLSTSRADILSQTDAVRVKSCWGGMMAVQARYVQSVLKEEEHDQHRQISDHVIDPERPRNVTAPIRFRYEPAAYYDACECCLFSADLAQVAEQKDMIFANPYIRVAYSESVIGWLRWVRYYERLLVPVHYFQSWFEPLAENPYRTVEEGDFFTEEVWDGDRWKMVNRKGRSGLFCGIRDMQILRKDGKRGPDGGGGSNWVNTRMPPGQRLRFRNWWGKMLPRSWRDKWERTDMEKREGFFEVEYA